MEDWIFANVQRATAAAAAKKNLKLDFEEKIYNLLLIPLAEGLEYVLCAYYIVFEEY